MPEKIGDWILTYTGKRVELGEPDPATICIEDIAWHLAGIGRYTGAASRTISVLEHSFYVMQGVTKLGGNFRQQLAGLLHDAPEAYIGDISTPMKRTVRAMSTQGGTALKSIDRRMDIAIQEALAIAYDSNDELVKTADLWAMAFERHALLPPHPEWNFDLSKAPFQIAVPKVMVGVPRSAMAYAFINAFRQLKDRIEREQAAPITKGILRQSDLVTA